MSIKATIWAWGQALKPGQKLVLLALADYANKKNTCWPGQEGIADKCCMDRATVNQHISELIKSGLIVQEYRHDEKGRRKASRYTLLVTEQPSASAESADPEHAPNVVNPNVVNPNVGFSGKKEGSRVVNHNTSYKEPSVKIEPSEKEYRSVPPATPPSNAPDGAPPHANAPPAVPKAVSKPGSRGTRLPADWTLPPEWAQWAVNDCVEQNVTLNFHREASKFADYWHGKSGQRACKCDWEATWRNWIRKAQEYFYETRNNNHSRKLSAAEQAAEAERRFDERVARESAARDSGPYPDGQSDSAPLEPHGSNLRSPVVIQLRPSHR